MPEQERRQTTRAVHYVSTHAGCSVSQACTALSPYSTARDGYASIQRAIRDGLIIRKTDPANPLWSQLYIAPEVTS